MPLFVHGDRSRLCNYNIASNVKKVSITDLVRFTPEDVVLITRAWSPIFAAIYQRASRPTIIQLADGIVTESNCKKKLNSKPHFLYENIAADIFFVRQPLFSLPSFIDRTRVRSIIDFKLRTETINFKSIMFVFGNDPFVSNSYDEIKGELTRLAKVIPAGTEVYYSTFSVVLSRLCETLFLNCRSVGSLSSFDQPMNSMLTVSTPSTVALDCSLQGLNVVRFACDECSTMKALFSSSSSIGVSEGHGGEAEIYRIFDVVDVPLDPFEQTRGAPYYLRLSVSGVRRLVGDFCQIFRK